MWEFLESTLLAVVGTDSSHVTVPHSFKGLPFGACVITP